MRYINFSMLKNMEKYTQKYKMGLLGRSIYLFTFYLLFFNVKHAHGNTKLVHSENIACHILYNSYKNNDSFQIVSLKEDNGLLDLLNVSKERINLYTILPKPSNNLIERWRGYYGLFHESFNIKENVVCC